MPVLYFALDIVGNAEIMYYGLTDNGEYEINHFRPTLDQRRLFLTKLKKHKILIITTGCYFQEYI